METHCTRSFEADATVAEQWPAQPNHNSSDAEAGTYLLSATSAVDTGLVMEASHSPPRASSAARELEYE